MTTLPPIKNAELVTRIFGYFPSFHDAEIIKVLCDRGEPNLGSPTINFTLHVWETTSDVTPSGHYKQDKHHLIEFSFFGVDSVDLHHFNHQNVLFELIILPIIKPKDHALISVEFSSSFGLEGIFRAINGEILSVSPCDENSDLIE